MRFGPPFLLLLWCAALPLRATSVVPPDFPALVAEADAIYRGQVTAVEARRVEGAAGGSVIKTFVTIEIRRTLKGPEQKEITLEFLGGTLGDETIEVSGVPKFTAGELGIVFVQQNGRQFCPLVRLGHGRYHVARDAAKGQEFVQRENRAPLRDVAEVEIPIRDTPAIAASRASSADALSVADFEAQVIAEVRQPSRRTQQP